MVKYETPVADVKALCGKFQAHAENFYLMCAPDETESLQLYIIALLQIKRKAAYVMKRLAGIGSANTCTFLHCDFAKEVIGIDASLKPDIAVAVFDKKKDEAVITAGSAESGLSELAKVEAKVLDKPLFALNELDKKHEDMDVIWNDAGLAVHDMAEYRVVFMTAEPGDKYEIYSILSVLSKKFAEAHKIYAVKPATTTPTPPPAGRTTKTDAVAKAAAIVTKETEKMSDATTTAPAAPVVAPTAPAPQADAAPAAAAGPVAPAADAAPGTDTAPAAEGGKIPRTKRTKEQILQDKTSESVTFLTGLGYKVEKADGSTNPIEDIKLVAQKLMASTELPALVAGLNVASDLSNWVEETLAKQPPKPVVTPEIRQQIELEVREAVKKELIAKMAAG